MSEAVKENENYIRIPYEFLSKGFTAAGLLTLGKIFTFSSANAKDGFCRSSFKTFAKDLRLSERQIARQVKELKAEKIVVQDKSRRAGQHRRTRLPVVCWHPHGIPAGLQNFWAVGR